MIKIKRSKRKSKEKLKNIHKKSDTRSDFDCLFPSNGARKRGLLTVEDHVWFEDQWMVAFWCDELLTTLCGLTLGQVLQVQVAA
jgi:hypothetical protein